MGQFIRASGERWACWRAGVAGMARRGRGSRGRRLGVTAYMKARSVAKSRVVIGGVIGAAVSLFTGAKA